MGPITQLKNYVNINLPGAWLWAKLLDSLKHKFVWWPLAVVNEHIFYTTVTISNGFPELEE